MRMLPWLATPGKPAMSPHAEGKKGTHDTDVIYMVETNTGGGVKNSQTMLEGWIALQRTRGNHAHVDDRRPLSAQAY